MCGKCSPVFIECVCVSTSMHWAFEALLLLISIVHNISVTVPLLHTGQNHATQPLGFWELLEYIVHEPPPVLCSEDGFSPELCDFVSQVSEGR